MINLTEKIKKLKDRGVVMTIQRRAVLECLDDENFHPSAEEIYRHLKGKYPSLSLATVYTNLDALARTGELQKLNLAPGTAHYDPLPTPHFHFYCESCCELSNIEAKRPITPKSEYLGNLVTTVQACFYGTCAKCLKRKEAPPFAEKHYQN